MSSPEVSKEILKQLNAIDPRAIFAWGYRAPMYTDDSLSFLVNGSKTAPNSRLTIKLNGKDLYDITIHRVAGVEVIYDAKEEDVYVEDLVKIIDSIVG